MKSSSLRTIAETIHTGFPGSEISYGAIGDKNPIVITFQGQVLIQIDENKAIFNFQTTNKSEMQWSGVIEGGPENIGEAILRKLADAGYEVFRMSGKRIKKSPVRVGKSTVCPHCKAKGEIKEILYGMPAADYDRQKFVLGGCTVLPDGSDPEIQCTKCEWEGTLEQVRFSR